MRITKSNLNCRPDVQFIAANGGNNITSLTIPSHSNGDWLVVCNGNRSATPPALISGYTDIGTFVNNGLGAERSTRVQYIVSDGTIGSVTVDYYGAVFILRYATRVGQTAFRNILSTTTVNTINFDPLSNLSTYGKGLILGSSYAYNLVTASTLANLAGAHGAYNLKNTSSNLSSQTISINNTYNISWIGEFLS